MKFEIAVSAYNLSILNKILLSTFKIRAEKTAGRGQLILIHFRVVFIEFFDYYFYVNMFYL